MFRRILFGLLFSFLLLLIAFALLVGGSSLARVAGDSVAEGVLWWIAMGDLLLAGLCLVSMVVVLALGSMERPSQGEQE